ncbi:hypothetical protein WISP_142925 [Willisornis vidua]|uniref:Uncharacterized protein n=1 Tax=Willisornis vidua TaxID=1566151 RepID=A0ABQ9CLJ5_9PASS|nr:hypothetical protein WISP_142925 [Willisornis vidua]
MGFGVLVHTGLLKEVANMGYFCYAVSVKGLVMISIMGHICIICINNCLEVVQDFTIHSNHIKQQHLLITVNIEAKNFCDPLLDYNIQQGETWDIINYKFHLEGRMVTLISIMSGSQNDEADITVRHDQEYKNILVPLVPEQPSVFLAKTFWTDFEHVSTVSVIQSWCSHLAHKSPEPNSSSSSPLQLKGPSTIYEKIDT